MKQATIKFDAGTRQLRLVAPDGTVLLTRRIPHPPRQGVAGLNLRQMYAVRAEVTRWAIRNGVEIVDQTLSFHEEPNMKPNSKSKKAATEPAANAPAPNGKATVDRFGTRLGTKFAAANATLTKKPKTMREIIDEAGLTETCYNHLNRLVRAKLIRRTKEGYSLMS